MDTCKVRAKGRKWFNSLEECLKKVAITVARKTIATQTM